MNADRLRSLAPNPAFNKFTRSPLKTPWVRSANWLEVWLGPSGCVRVRVRECVHAGFWCLSVSYGVCFYMGYAVSHVCVGRVGVGVGVCVVRVLGLPMF